MSRPIVSTLLALALGLIAPVVRAQPNPRPATPAAAHESAGVVNVNDGTAEELERLPGIGPAKARAIVEHRRTHPFHKLDELTKVKGIGRKTFGKLRPYVTLSGPTTLTSEPRKN